MSELEQVLRQRIMDALAARAARNSGVVTRTELGAFDTGDGQTRRLIDAGGRTTVAPPEKAQHVCIKCVA